MINLNQIRVWLISHPFLLLTDKLLKVQSSETFAAFLCHI